MKAYIVEGRRSSGQHGMGSYKYVVLAKDVEDAVSKAWSKERTFVGANGLSKKNKPDFVREIEEDEIMDAGSTYSY